MTQEQKQFIIKTLECGIPAIAKAHIDAIEEVAFVAAAKQEDLNGQEDWGALNQVIHENIVNTLRGSLPFMANEYIGAYYEAVSIGQEKFKLNRKAREEKEAAEAEQVSEAPENTPENEKTPA